MTRYTAKPSGRRLPQKATPWNKLKNPVAESEPKQEELKKSKKIVWKRAHNSEDVEDLFPEPKPQKLKRKNNFEYKRRKPLTDIPSIYKEGCEIGIVRFEGFPVSKSDAERLTALKKKLLESKVPHDEIKKTMKFERRRAEKALSREKKKICFNCRNSGHVLSECPQLLEGESDLVEAGICFKCGSTEHQHMQCHVRGDLYKHAICFICKQEGHISKQCPDNPKGLYPEGGGCRICGDVTHLKKDCIKFNKRKKEDYEVTVKMLDDRATDALDDDLDDKPIIAVPKKKKKLVTM